MRNFSAIPQQRGQAPSGSIGRSAILSAMATILLGAFILFGVGFAGVPAVHDAVHDTRHGAGFPCH